MKTFTITPYPRVGVAACFGVIALLAVVAPKPDTGTTQSYHFDASGYLPATGFQKVSLRQKNRTIPIAEKPIIIGNCVVINRLDAVGAHQRADQHH